MTLIGYMGSGKSSVGRELAARLGRSFVDLDQEIEARAKCSIPHIFATSGEEGFRKLEYEALREALGGGTDLVVSCGGGVVTHAGSRELLSSVATVFLEEDLDVLFMRTRGANRPLRGGSRKEFVGRYGEREPLYREVADVIVACRGRTQGELVGEVERWLAG